MNLNTKTSDSINEIVSALAKAQGKMKPAVFNRVNPHFKTKYADFTSCMEACRQPLSENGLAVVQFCETIDTKLNLVTLLAHTSGQWIKSEFPLVAAKMDSQGIGSAMTYAKRYSLCGVVGVVADEEGDDDGETAVGRGSYQKKELTAPEPIKMEVRKVITKMSDSQVNSMKKLEEKLDSECKAKIYKWISTTYKTTALEEIPSDAFSKVMGALENAVKYMENAQLEVAHV